MHILQFRYYTQSRLFGNDVCNLQSLVVYTFLLIIVIKRISNIAVPSGHRIGDFGA